MPKEIRHTAFLIRWQAEGDQTRWRATAENVYTGEKFHFADKQEMLLFLEHALYGSQVRGTFPAPHDRKEDA